MPVLSAGLLAGLSALSAAANLGGNIATNVFNYNIAKENREFQHDEAAINREWQTNMSNTAYQRSMSDMQAAGLNPNIMAGNSAQVGSVSTPQGSTATMQAPQFDNFLNGLTSALNAYSNLKLVNSLIDKNKSIIDVNESKYILNASKDDLNRQLWSLRSEGAVKGSFTDHGSYFRY